MKVDLFTIGKLTLHSYGVLIGIGIVVGTLIAYYRAKKREDLLPDKVFDIVIVCVVLGFIGAKIFFVFENFKEFLESPKAILGSSGFVVYGGIILGVISVIVFCKMKKLVFRKYFDIVIPSVAIAQGFGRLGCFMAGCCYGKETTAWWGVTFTDTPFAPCGVPLIPTQLISAGGDFIIGLVLIAFAKKSKHPGDVGALYLLLYGVGRFCVEFLRTNTQGGIGPVTTAQCVSIVIVACGIFLFVFNHKIKPAIDEKPAVES